MAALDSEPTWSSVISGVTTLDPGSGATTWDGPVLEPTNHRSSASGSPTVADRPMRWMSRPVDHRESLQYGQQVPSPVIPAEGVDFVHDDGAQPPKNSTWSRRTDIKMASSDSGVVRRISGGSAIIRSRAPGPTSPCQSPARNPTKEPYRSSLGCKVIQKGPKGADVEDREAAPASVAIRDSSGSMAASVLPPAVGARPGRAPPRGSGRSPRPAGGEGRASRAC